MQRAYRETRVVRVMLSRGNKTRPAVSPTRMLTRLNVTRRARHNRGRVFCLSRETYFRIVQDSSGRLFQFHSFFSATSLSLFIYFPDFCTVNRMDTEKHTEKKG